MHVHISMWVFSWGDLCFCCVLVSCISLGVCVHEGARCGDVYFTIVLLRLVWCTVVFEVSWRVEGVTVGSVSG